MGPKQSLINSDTYLELEDRLIGYRLYGATCTTDKQSSPKLLGLCHLQALDSRDAAEDIVEVDPAKEKDMDINKITTYLRFNRVASMACFAMGIGHLFVETLPILHFYKRSYQRSHKLSE